MYLKSKIRNLFWALLVVISYPTNAVVFCGPGEPSDISSDGDTLSVSMFGLAGGVLAFNWYVIASHDEPGFIGKLNKASKAIRNNQNLILVYPDNYDSTCSTYDTEIPALEVNVVPDSFQLDDEISAPQWLHDASKNYWTFVNENETAVVSQVWAMTNGDEPLTYSIISGNDAQAISIEQETGKLSIVDTPNYENPLDSNNDNVFEITVRATAGNETVDAEIRIAVSDHHEGRALARDFDGDGFGDILYRHNEELTWQLDLMNGDSIQSSFEMSSMSTCCGWLFNGIGDFNADGYDDVIIRNTQSGRWYIYNLQGDLVVSRGYVPLEDAQAVAVQAVADFNQDGFDDVLLRNEQTGEWSINLLRNREILDTISPDMSKVLSWEIVAAKDFDGNGSPDILIRNRNSGAWYIYQYENTSVIQRGYVSNLSADLDEEVQAIGDFNGDGQFGILFRNKATLWWNMSEFSGMQAGNIRNIMQNYGENWSINDVNDYNGDGFSDITLRDNSTGQVAILNMIGSSIIGEFVIDAGLPIQLEAKRLN